MTVEKKNKVFLSHNGADKQQVERLGRLLRKEHGIESWLDKWNLIPGQPWQEAIEIALMDCDAIAVCVGPSDLSPWQNREMRLSINRQVNNPESPMPVIPVLLPGAERPDRGTLPGFLIDNTWVEFRNGLENANSLARLAAGIQGAEPGDLEQSPLNATTPYRGLEAFEVEHSKFFFGRKALTEWLVDAIRTQSSHRGKSRFIAVVGSSGSGKSSLVKAGLLAEIWNNAIPGSKNWPVIQMRADGDPIETLAMALDKKLHLDLSADKFRSLRKDLQENTDSLHLTAGRALHDLGDQRLVIFIDQFEEIFSTDRESVRRSFIDNIMAAAADVTGHVVVIITLRSDFYGRCAKYSTLAQALNDHQWLVGPMSDIELKRAIEQPAFRVGAELETGLTQRLISDFQEQTSGLPLLQFALEQIWNNRAGRRLTNAAYDNLGGLGGALDSYATKVYETELDEEQQKACEQIFLRLTRPGERSEDTKCRIDAGTLEQDPVAAGALKKLTDARLITMGELLSDTFSAVEIAHEALIWNWSKLRYWLEQDRQAHRTQTALSEATSEWDKNDRDNSFLYRGARLRVAKEWLEKYSQNAISIEKEYLDQSERYEVQERQRDLLQAQQLAEEQKLRADEQVKTTNSLSYLVRWLGVVAIVAIVFALFGLYQSNRASQEAREAINQTKIADEKAIEAEKQTKIAEINAIEAGNQKSIALDHARRAVDNESRAFTALSQSMSANAKYVEAIKLALAAWPRNSKDSRPTLQSTVDAMSVAFRGNRQVASMKHDDAVYGATYLPEIKRILTWSHDNTARLWDEATGAQVVVMKHEAAVNGATYLPETERILTWSDDNTARLWDETTSAEVAVMQHRNSVLGATNLPEMKQILTWSEDNTARLWDETTGAQVAMMKHDGSVNGAIYLPDTKRILTWSSDNTARLWDDTTGASITVMQHDRTIFGATHLPEIRRILTWSADNTARLWDESTGMQVAMVKHDDSVNGTTYLPQMKQILTWSEDNTARLWDETTGAQVAMMTHESSVLGATYLPETKQILTWSNDSTARLWDTGTGAPAAVIKHDSIVNGATYLPETQQILTWSWDNTARLSDGITGASIAVMKHEDNITGVEGATYLPETKRILTWSWDNSARLWDGTTGASIAVMKHDKSVLDATYVPETKQILTWSRDNTVRLWDGTSDASVAIMKHDGSVGGATYLPETNRILTWSVDGTARLWDEATGAQMAVMKHDDVVYGATYLPETKRILTWSRDNTARLWDENTGAQVAVLKHDSEVGGAIYLPEAKWFLTWSADSAARLWDGATGTQLVVMQHDDGVYGATHLPKIKRVLTWSRDNTARLWDENTGAQVAVMKHDDSVQGATYLPDTKQILTWSHDTTARLWDETTGAQVAVMQHGSMLGATCPYG